LHPENTYLVGLACLFVAAKIEDVVVPGAWDFVVMSGRGFSEEQLFDMEAAVLTQLDFKLVLPTAKAFLDEYAEQHKQSAPLVYHLGCYLCDISLLDYTLTTARPSRIAAAAYTLANTLVRAHGGAAALPLLKGQDVTGAELEQLSTLHASVTVGNNGSIWATTQKYSSAEYCQVAYIAPFPVGTRFGDNTACYISHSSNLGADYPFPSGSMDTTFSDNTSISHSSHLGGEYPLGGHSTVSNNSMQQVQQQQPPPAAPAAAAAAAPEEVFSFPLIGAAAVSCLNDVEPAWLADWNSRTPMFGFA
jgi:hypothetical protein